MELDPSPSKPPASLIGENHLAELLAAASRTPPGCFVEVGVYRGGSAWRLLQLAKEQGRELYLYDTFEGIPCQDPIDNHSIGDFADVNISDVTMRLEGAHVIKGVFPASAVPMPWPIAFAHLDCDQYRSVFESAEYLTSRMAVGGIIWFDDSPCLPGAHQAARELFGDRLQLSSDHGKHYVVI